MVKERGIARILGARSRRVARNQFAVAAQEGDGRVVPELERAPEPGQKVHVDRENGNPVKAAPRSSRRLMVKIWSPSSLLTMRPETWVTAPAS